MVRNGCDLKLVTEWRCPDGGGAPIISMPNLPKPLHGVAPRTLLGTTTWNRMRKACYINAEYKCEVCGAEVGKDIEKRQLHAHELYEIDYVAGTSKFVRCIALCSKCHLGGIHTGRAITLYKQNNPLYPKEFLLAGAENAFKLIHDYNEKHPKEQLRAYSTFIEYLKHEDLEEPMRELIEKYDIKFYEENTKVMAEWPKWKLIIGEKEFPTPYKDGKDWEEAMKKRAEKDTGRMAKNNFNGTVYEELDKILKGK